MYEIEYLDESIIDECKKSFRRVYPEFTPIVLGASKDRRSVIIQCDFPDGTYYFRVDERSVSSGYKSLDDADRE